MRGGVTVVTARDGLFDALPECDASAPLAAEVLAELCSAIVGAAAVVVDLRGAGEVNKRTLSVSFQMARAVKVCGRRGALCGSATLKQIWEVCWGNTVCDLYEDIEEACVAVGAG
jgi:hypothetical protein